MGLTAVPDGEVATIVTTLEMRQRPPVRPMAPAPFALTRWPAPASARYLALFRRVGAPWLWFSRLVMPDEALRHILDDPAVEVYAAIDRAGIEIGMVELDFRSAGQCELSYFGLVPELAGKGHGGWMMATALTLAWRKGVERVWVHTCTLDHPAALGFYRRHGFAPIKRMIETFPDPRLTGALPRDSAPQIPLFETGPDASRR
ncbi:MAG: GNAT family N-acetyltransferase [Pseudomonadota bacterium]|uniref:GNAT family N-acetyltransferase n=1 Tax=Sphingomonas sp. ERG5 TaxID=1381597 RepID=UPI00054B9CF5|nr:GNAT family N-acetyltransferase [Sphingomonas sp. ERG5]